MLSVLRQRALCHTSIASVSRNADAAVRDVTIQAGRRALAPTTPFNTCQLLRCQGTAAAGKKTGEVFKYPEWLNVYRLSSTATLCMGFTRVFTLVVFGLGSCVYAPGFYFSPDHTNWMVPAFIIGSAVPMIAVIMASGPSVHAIRVNLPTSARRSREGLLKFANNVPPRTLLQLESMKLIPWPTKTPVIFADLTRHKPSWKGGLSNLENTPLKIQGDPAVEGTLYHSLFRRLFGRYYVQRDQAKDRSAAPGVWDKMWEQIPEVQPSLGKSHQHKPLDRSSTQRTQLKPLPPAHGPKPKTRP